MFYCNSRATGVYRITCLVNGYVYIGSTLSQKGFKDRLKCHRTQLNQGKHHSSLLQADWDKYGKDSFVFEIIEECEPSVCRKREQFWLDAQGVGEKNKSYNTSSLANRPEFPRVVTEQTKHKISDKLAKKHFVVTSPEGEEIYVTNLPKFCRQKGLNKSHMYQCAKGAVISHMEWRCRYAFETKEDLDAKVKLLPSIAKKKEYLAISPTNEIFFFSNMEAFCREHDLHPSAMRKMAEGKVLNHKGWKCKFVEESKEIEHRRLNMKGRGRHYVVTTPTGESLIITNLKDFCQKRGLNKSCMLQVIKGLQKHHLGYIVTYIEDAEKFRTRRLTPKGEHKKNDYVITNLITGEKFKVRGLAEFCREHGLNQNGLSRTATGTRRQYRGYVARYADAPPPQPAPQPAPQPPSLAPTSATDSVAPTPPAAPTYHQLSLFDALFSQPAE